MENRAVGVNGGGGGVHINARVVVVVARLLELLSMVARR
jgi:hypothetical protein